MVLPRSCCIIITLSCALCLPGCEGGSIGPEATVKISINEADHLTVFAPGLRFRCELRGKSEMVSKSQLGEFRGTSHSKRGDKRFEFLLETESSERLRIEVKNIPDLTLVLDKEETQAPLTLSPGKHHLVIKGARPASADAPIEP